MGKQQVAHITLAQQCDLACHQPCADLKIAIGTVQGLLNAKKSYAEISSHFGPVVMARARLVKALPEFKQSVTALDTFVKEKSKRWLGKSTLSQAKTTLGHYQGQLKDYEDLIALSKTF